MNLLLKVFVFCFCIFTIQSSPLKEFNLNDLIRLEANRETEQPLQQQQQQQNEPTNTENDLESSLKQEIGSLLSSIANKLQLSVPQLQQQQQQPSGLVQDETVRVNKTKRLVRKRRQNPLAFAGGLGVGFGAYDYNDYYGDYSSDYNYDYYDWVCTERSCQLCNILGGECCDPQVDPNCFLPDSCLNNPCLGGGTCITTKNIAGDPDFICVCLPGLTGKYCQLTNDYFVGAELFGSPLPPVLPPPLPVVPIPQVVLPPGPPAVLPAYQLPVFQPPPPPPQPEPVYQEPYPAPPPPAPVYNQPAPVYNQPAPPPVYNQPAPPPPPPPASYGGYGAQAGGPQQGPPMMG